MSGITVFSFSNYKNNNNSDSNLVVYYDPSNVTCYSGTGTTVTDLSGNGFNASLLDGASWSNAAGTANGAFILSGGALNTSAIVTSDLKSVWYNGSSENMSIEIWAKPNSQGSLIMESNFTTAGYGSWIQSLMACVTVSGLEYKVGYWNNMPYYTSGGSNPSTGSWSQFVWTYSSSGSGSLIGYRNGIAGTTLIGQKEYPWDDGIANKYAFWIGRDLTGAEGQIGTNYGWDGMIGIIKIYNRTLTASEVINSFNSTKSKYSIT